MQFPDQSHINRVRDALWRRSPSATVMVGSGFSRNAERILPNALPSPTWRDLVEAMYAKLYPHDEDRHKTPAITVGSATSDALRLAQEYVAAFGRTDLHGFLRSLIRDEAFRPGRFHERLLRLRWRDVFTTNWDTLLERTCPAVPERSYSVIRSPDEIPLATGPRIVKLHGSTDAHFPLIFTEEDYRTYPKEFAPFVNTVQQAMMETVFCLIGFSGDDPNFLHWSGWVRDNLGLLTPKIYLAGWLGLSTHRRRMLEERNVVPIDLAGHPKADQWPVQTRHQRAIDWLLHTLEHGEPYDLSRWPSHSPRTGASVPEWLEPVPQEVIGEPKAEPAFTLSGDQSIEAKKRAVRNLLEVWGYNRTKTYPGWLTAPAEVRGQMSSTRETAAPLILGVLPHLGPVDRLNALRELLWRWEIQLEPISVQEPTSLQMEEAALDVLGQIDCQTRKIDGDSDPSVDWPGICEAWVAVASALATAGRFRFDADEFNRRLSAVEPFQVDNQEIEHFVRHERCLWAIYSLDYKSLEEMLDDWNTGNCDPVWMMRKAALLFEIGEQEQAQELNIAALAAIRRAPSDDRSVATASREAWAHCCSGATLGFEESWHASIERWHRWDELTPLKCNARLEMRYSAEAIRGESPLEKGRHFDLGKVWREGFSYSRGEFLRWAASHRAVRLAEIAGLPPSVGDRPVASTNLELAARQLFAQEPELAARLVLRATKHEQRGTLNVVLSRAHVATMPPETVNRLSQSCIDAIEFMLARIAVSHGRGHWMKRLPVVIEALSRFVLRLDPQRLDSILTRTLGWYKHAAVATAVGMADPVRNILSRSWEALPEEPRTARILDLLSAPIVGMDQFTAGIVGADGQRLFVHQYPDPCDHLRRNDIRAINRTASDETRWNDTVKFLVRGLRTWGEARRRASTRIGWLIDHQVLTTDEETDVAEALWGEDYTNHDKLPTGTDLHDWAFLVLPQPRQGLAEQRFRARWLTDSPAESPRATPDEVLWQVGSAIGNLKTHGKPLSFTEQERFYLTDLIGRWAEAPTPIPFWGTDESPTIFPGGADNNVRNAISGAQYVLLEIDIPLAVANTLHDKVQNLNKSEMPAHTLFPGLTRALPERFEDIVQSMRMGMASDDDRVASNAVAALEFWLRDGMGVAVGLVPPPADLIQELGVIIANRRRVALVQALQAAKWVFSEGDSKQQNAIGNLATQGLRYLAEELRYDRTLDEDKDLPLLRWGCTHLAIAMARHGFDTEPIVARWRENSRDDPLPEVRHADSPINA